jgi:molecular chaperone HscC
MTAIIGIDLGTTNSLASCFMDGKCVLIPNVFGEYMTPSVVSVLENGEAIVGRAAKERLYTHPERTAAAFKRFMGTGKSYQLADAVFTSTALSSIVIKSLKEDATAFLGACPEEAVISVPAYFNDQQRRATKEAGELAGLRVERLINEPTAAALAYGLHEIGEETKFLVFDLGGGTFDVSIVDLFENILEVKAVAGDNYLGGEDFDSLIADYFVSKQQLSASLEPLEWAAIKEKAEACKIALTRADAVEMRVMIGDRRLSEPMNNKLLERIAEPVLSRLKKPVLRALRDSRLEVRDLDHIILVGGATRMPIVRSYVARIFERLPMNNLNPDEVVALGAGIRAAMKARDEDLNEHYMTDICPYTLGVDMCMEDQFGRQTPGHFAPIIERNTTVPCSKVIRAVTVYDNQRHVQVGIYQGESRLVEDNLKLGEVSIALPLKPAGQAAVDIRYTYDINGILEVEVTSADTGKTERKLIVNAETDMTKEEIEAHMQQLAHLKMHPREHSRNRFLIARGERLYEESLSHARAEIGAYIRRFEAVLDRQEPIEIEMAAREFEDFLNAWESMLQ